MFDGYLWYIFLFVISYIVLQYTVIGFYIRAFYYGMCLIVGAGIGGTTAIPHGKTPNNHFRIFKVFQSFCWPLGLQIELRNSEILNDPQPYIIIANHQSALDVLGMTYAWPVNCIVMLKSSLKYLPGFNLCAYLCDAVYINRFSKEKAHKTVDNTLAQIVENKRKVWIYPEGTRNPDDELLPFKKGAFILAKQAKIPIVCCVFSSHKFVYSYAEKRFHGGRIVADILPIVDTSKFETIDEMSEHCRKLIQEHKVKLDREVAASIH